MFKGAILLYSVMKATVSACSVFKGAVVLVCKEDQRHKWKLTLTRKQGREVLEDREREVVLFKRMVPVSQLQIRNSNTNGM